LDAKQPPWRKESVATVADFVVSNLANDRSAPCPTPWKSLRCPIYPTDPSTRDSIKRDYFSEQRAAAASYTETVTRQLHGSVDYVTIKAGGETQTIQGDQITDVTFAPMFERMEQEAAEANWKAFDQDWATLATNKKESIVTEAELEKEESERKERERSEAAQAQEQEAAWRASHPCEVACDLGAQSCSDRCQRNFDADRARYTDAGRDEYRACNSDCQAARQECDNSCSR